MHTIHTARHTYNTHSVSMGAYRKAMLVQKGHGEGVIYIVICMLQFNTVHRNVLHTCKYSPRSVIHKQKHSFESVMAKHKHSLQSVILKHTLRNITITN